MMNGSFILARFVSELRCDALGAALRAHACAVATDLGGVIAAGMREPEMRRLAQDTLSRNGQGPCEVIGYEGRVAPADAAFLHGTAGTFLELDEGNRFSRGHPGIHVFPAALAAAQQCRASGAELLAALVAGYEIAARLGAACEIRPVIHPHGTWGTVGAAVAVAKLRGADAPAIERVINIASTLGLATSVKTMHDGATVRNAFAGISARMGFVANELADAGFTGERDGLASVYGEVVATGFHWDRMLHGLGERWEMQRNYFKLHACCRFNHAALDALVNALRDAGDPPRADDIERIDVDTYSLAARLVNAQPSNSLAAKYSLPFAIATAIVHGTTGIEAFAAPAVRHPEVLRLAAKVRVREDAAMTQRLPSLRQARVTVQLHDGGQHRGFAHTNRGDAEEPLDDEELRSKFMALARGTWSAEQACRLRSTLLALDTLPDASALFAVEEMA